MSKGYSVVTTDEVEAKKEDLKVLLDRDLTTLDRCDRCRAQAYVRILFLHDNDRTRTTEILLCGHDFTKREIIASAQAVEVDDQRHRINQRSNASADAI